MINDSIKFVKKLAKVFFFSNIKERAEENNISDLYSNVQQRELFFVEYVENDGRIERRSLREKEKRRLTRKVR